jgi:PPM family protein phosphatase
MILDLGSRDFREEVTARLISWLSEPDGLGRSFKQTPDGACIASWIGKRDDNQDEVVFCKFAGIDNGGRFRAAILSDGIGGLRDGALAAKIATASVVSQLLDFDATNPEVSLRRAVSVANETVYEMLRGRGGCTLSVLVCTSNRIAIGNVGDSRIFGFAADGTKQLTTDDTIAAYADSMGRQAGNASDLRGLAQFIGMGAGLDARIESIADSFTDFLLTSDGIHFIGQQNIDVLKKHASNARTFAQRLIHLAEWYGGSDNASLAFVPMASLKAAVSSSPDGTMEIWSPRESAQIWLIMPAHVQVDTLGSDRSLKKSAPPKLRKEGKKRRAADQRALTAPDVVLDFGSSSGSTSSPKELHSDAAEGQVPGEHQISGRVKSSSEANSRKERGDYPKKT